MGRSSLGGESDIRRIEIKPFAKLIFSILCNTYTLWRIHYPMKPPSVMKGVCKVKMRMSCCKGRFYLPLTFFIYAFMFLATFLLQINTNDKGMEQRRLHR